MAIRNDTTIESSLEEERRGYEEGQGDYESSFEDDREESFDYYEGDYDDGQSFNDYRDYDEYTIIDSDENLDILEEEDEDEDADEEDADEEDFHQEPGVIEPSPDLNYSTLLMYFKRSFNVIKQPFKELKKQTQMCDFIFPILPYT